MRATLTAAIAAAFLAVSVAPTMGAPGDLDPTFNGNGKLVFNPGGGTSNVRAVVVQPDGKIVLAGEAVSSAANGSTAMAVTRLNADGSIDEGFGTRGTTTVPFPDTSRGGATGVALQSDGKIVVIGGAGKQDAGRTPKVARLERDGNLDLAFDPGGDEGAGKKDLFFTGSVSDVAIDPQGRILIAGIWDSAGFANTGLDFMLIRLDGNGASDATFHSPDNSFGVAIDFGGFDGASGLALQPDGGAILAGASIANLNAEVAVAKVSDRGALDTGFANGGKLKYGFNAADFGWDVVVEPGGKIDVGASGDAANEFLVTRLTSSGAFDNSLNGTTTTTANFGGSGQSHTIALQANGKIVLSGWNADSFAVARFQPGGALDSTFGQGGKKTVAFPGANAQAWGMALQPDGKIVLAGDVGVSVAVARLEGDSAAAGGAPGGVGPGGSGGSGGGGGTGGSGTSRVPRCGGKSATIVGTAGKDRLKGTRRADVIAGLAGNDRISGLAGNDVICGGAGNDKISGGSGNDRLAGDAGKDSVSGDNGNDSLAGGSGVDKLNGNAGRDKLNGNAGRDKLNGGGGKDSCAGKDSKKSC